MKLKKAFEALEDKVYVTRKCRIEAAERNKRMDSMTLGINVWYSAILLIISIVILSRNDLPDISIVSITSAILVFSISMIVATQQYKDKYYAFKSCYLELDYLHKKIIRYIDIEQFNNDDYQELNQKYNEILKSSENHKPIDYYTVLMKDIQLAEKYKKKYPSYKRDWYIKQVIQWLLIILFVFIPFLTPIALQLVVKWVTMI